ncbi:MAG: hypothetical protein ABJE95_13690 [Byssovorax sp.]
MEKHHLPRPLTDQQLAEIAHVGGEGLKGRGRLTGEIQVEGHVVTLITAGKGTRSQVSFTLDMAGRKARHLQGKAISVSGTLHKITAYHGTITHTTVVDRPAAHHVPGEHLALAGKIDNREPVAIGGEAPPTGSYLVLDAPLDAGSSPIRDVFLDGRTFPQGTSVKLYGRLDARTYGGVETAAHAYAALSGISDLGAGEPSFDGAQFHSATNNAHLRVLITHRRDLFDAPNVIVVLDPASKRAFVGSQGGHIRVETNPFHGFTGSAEIAPPTDADRAAVVFNKEGNPIVADTGAELLKVGEEQAPPGTADMFSHAWYFDDATETVYTFVSGGIAGFVNRMESVIHLGA